MATVLVFVVVIFTVLALFFCLSCIVIRKLLFSFPLHFTASCRASYICCKTLYEWHDGSNLWAYFLFNTLWQFSTVSTESSFFLKKKKKKSAKPIFWNILNRVLFTSTFVSLKAVSSFHLLAHCYVTKRQSTEYHETGGRKVDSTTNT